MIENIISLLGQNSENYNQILNSNRILVKGTHLGERTFLVSLINKKTLYIVSSFQQIQETKRIFESFGKRVLVLEDCLDSLASQMSEPSGLCQLNFVLNSLCENSVDVVIAYAGTLMQRVPNKDFYKKQIINLEVGKSVNLNELVKEFVNIGYLNSEELEDVGNFRLKGDVLDVTKGENLVRVEFFGNEIDSIRILNKEFKTLEKLSTISFLPNKICFNNETLLNLPTSEHYSGNILKWFLSDLVVFDEPSRIWAVLENEYNEKQKDVIRQINEKILNNDFAKLYLSVKENVISTNFSKVIAFETFDVGNRFFASNSVFLSCPKVLKYKNDVTQFYADIAYFDRLNYTIVICSQDQQGEKIVQQRLKDLNISYKKEKHIVKNAVNLVQEKIEVGFGFLDDKILVFTTHSFDGYVKKKVEKEDKIRVFYLPKVGDYVVHEKYGIAKCREISRLNFGINEKDYFVLEYANGGTLYIPSEHVNELSSYVGDKEPKLETLGSDSFRKAKEKAKASVKQLAYDLKKLYALRESKKGYVYECNEELTQEFLDSFGFELTPDQKNAIAEVQNDMTSGKIMDRLICGDVGFGKTEIALVSSFITVLNQKQVAVLVPTSVLCNQHYNTFKKRFAEFGVTVAMLSRFQTAKKNKEVVDGLKSGKINIVCATKKLLSNGVDFQNLGLLVLDEEQRFGVNDKEKIKNLKKDVNVLTLSATPIPRTLNMSLIGVRDISLITTPPKNRQTVQTVVCEENESFIKEACIKELARGGQILVIYNRVENILCVANKIAKLVPNAKVGVAHGQMSRIDLENAIMKLYSGETQIMIATTLIENGVDLPMANTLIVLDANNFGLSQLYQLKGRVGRSERNAYAFFMYKKEEILTQTAYERLKAIKEFTTLGSGFKLAMRDLELRGAGDILGANQSGHIVKIGYDMYCKLIEEAMQELNGNEDILAKRDIHIDVCIPAYISHSFVKDEQERINLYNKISNISTEERKKEIELGITSTYGKITNEISELTEIALIKNISQSLFVKKIEIKNNIGIIEFYEKQSPDNLQILNKFNFVQNNVILNRFEIKSEQNAKNIQNVIKNCLLLMKNNVKNN